MIRIDVLHKGDEVMQVTPEAIVIKRKNGEVDVLPVIKESVGWRIDQEGSVRIGYGNNTVTADIEPGVEVISF